LVSSNGSQTLLKLSLARDFSHIQVFMTRSLRAAAGLLIWAAACFPVPAVCQTQAVPSIRKVQVLHTQGQVEIEIEASGSVVPRTNVITNPDRLIVDFVNAVPGAQLRNQTVSRGEVKGLRVGLFSSDPPVTRVVLDLNSPQPYQVFPSGRTVIVKVGVPDAETAVHSASPPALVNTNYPASGRPPFGADSDAADAAGATAASSEAGACSFLSPWSAFDQFQQGHHVRSSFRDSPADRGGDRHSGGSGTRAGCCQYRAGSSSGSSVSVAERFQVQFSDSEFVQRSSQSGPRYSQFAPRRAHTAAATEVASPRRR
jgi:hypothetical protein